MLGAIAAYHYFGHAPVPGYTYVKESHPLGIAISCAIALQGLVIGPFLLVVAEAADRLGRIHSMVEDSISRAEHSPKE